MTSSAQEALVDINHPVPLSLPLSVSLQIRPLPEPDRVPSGACSITFSIQKDALALGPNLDETRQPEIEPSTNALAIGRRSSAANHRFSAEMLMNFMWELVDHDSRKQLDSNALGISGFVACSQVCRFWRQVALDYHEAWARTLQPELDSHRWFSTKLARSKNSPIVLLASIPSIPSFPANLTLKRENTIRRNFSLAFTLHNRLEYIFIRIGNVVFWDPHEFQEFLGCPFPLLKAFTLLQGTTTFYGMLPCNDTLFARRAPKLRTLQLGGAFPLHILRDPTIPVHRLTHLIVHQYGRPLEDDHINDFSTSFWVRLLSQTPGLETLVLNGAVFEDSQAWPDSIGHLKDEPPSLPALSLFKLAGPLNACSELLASVKFPTDCNLSVIFLGTQDDDDDFIQSIERLTPLLLDRQFQADAWQLGVGPSFVLSGLLKGLSTFHFEVVWDSNWRFHESISFDAITRVFMDFVAEFNEAHRAVLHRVPTVSINVFADATMLTVPLPVDQILSPFINATHLRLQSLRSATINTLFGHFHDRTGTDRGEELVYLFPRVTSLFVDISAFPPLPLPLHDSPGTEVDFDFRPVHFLSNALRLRSDNPVASIRRLSFLPSPHRFSEPQEMNFSVADVSPYLSPEVLSQVTLDVEDGIAAGFIPKAADRFIYQVNAEPGMTLKPVEFDQTYFG